MADAPPQLTRALAPAEIALRLHRHYRGKVQTAAKCPVQSLDDFAIWYTPGVAAPCLAIQREPETVYEYTNKGNSIAIVTDGTRVLGLGDIGPSAGLPVMEGKALLFKHLGGVDAVPIGLHTRSAEEIVRAVELIEPAFGGINLEDIAQPKCFRVLDALRERLSIPVWHDDQQGAATVVLAAVRSALAITGKRLDAIRIAMIGMGAANVATYRLLVAAGADPRAIVACDSRGALHRDRADIADRRADFVEKWEVCERTNGDRVRGGIAQALRGADLCIAFSQSGPGVIHPEWVRAMARDAIVFACANPVPEIWPWEARAAGARIVATGRSDFPNQVNNSLIFPGLFRGVLDVRAKSISSGMAMAAAAALAGLAKARGADEEHLLPPTDDVEAAVCVAVAAGLAAQTEGLARIAVPATELEWQARRRIDAARTMTAVLASEGIIEHPPRD